MMKSLGKTGNTIGVFDNFLTTFEVVEYCESGSNADKMGTFEQGQRELLYFP